MTASGINAKILNLKSFLISGLTFEILSAVWDYFDKGKIDFVKIIFTTVFFGAFMS
jgi:hypothetical protein